MIWTVLWGALALFALLGANRSADGLAQQVRALGPGEPAWLATLDRHAANVIGHHGLAVSIALAVVLGVIALGASLPWRPARVVIGGRRRARPGPVGARAELRRALLRRGHRPQHRPAPGPGGAGLLETQARLRHSGRAEPAPRDGSGVAPPWPNPTWLAYSFAVVMVVVSLYCVGWLIAARARSRQNHMDVNVSHVAMGLAMAGMLVPRLKVLPDGVWEAVFVAIALWFTWHGVRFVGALASVIGSPGPRTGCRTT